MDEKHLPMWTYDWYKAFFCVSYPTIANIAKSMPNVAMTLY